MSEFIRLYTQIALLRRGPQDLPASRLLLVLTVAGYLAVNFVVSGVLPPGGRWLETLLVATLFTLLWYLLLLRLAGRPERTLQTTTAVFGFQAVLTPLVDSCAWLVRRVGEDSPWQLPFMIFSPRSLSDACAAGAAGSACSETASATTNTSAAAEIALLTVRS